MAPTNTSRKFFNEGKWYRTKDGRVVCNTLDCLNVVKRRDLCIRHLGYTKKCEHLTCEKIPGFNIEGAKSGRFCKEHAFEGMVNVGHLRKRCKYEGPDGCNVEASFNYPGQKIGLWCVAHRPEGTIHTTHQKCDYEKCTQRSSWKFSDSKISILRCMEHKLPNMVNFVTKRCKHFGCNITATSNYPDKKKGVYCKSHRLPGMIYISHHICDEHGCHKRGRYGDGNVKKCSKHKTTNMIPLFGSRKCEHPDCEIYPSFNFKNEKKARFCEQHKLHDMINVRSSSK